MYNIICIEGVEEAKQSAKKTMLHYRSLKRFDICNVNGIDKLIAPTSKTNHVIKCYVKNEDIFDILHEIMCLLNIVVGTAYKVVQLAPLNSKTAEVVSKVFLDIFCIFGAPSILQSDNGREFVTKVVEILMSMWTELKIISVNYIIEPR